MLRVANFAPFKRCVASKLAAKSYPIARFSLSAQNWSLSTSFTHHSLRSRISSCSSRFASSSAQVPRKPFFPVNSANSVGYWLIGTSGIVFGIVVLGGLTRLTESGLSITEWKPITGAIPPLTDKDWEEQFEKYKDSPEFRQLNSHITLEEYKFIFYMEWSHRLVGRIIGGVLVLPALYFIGAKKVSSGTARRLVGLGLLLALQGVVGWWMVYSGIDEKQLEDRNSKPTVSQYRLTTHLGAAFLLYMGMLWTGWGILAENRWIKEPQNAINTLNKIPKGPKYVSRGLVLLTFITAMSGAMVAGLDAGLVYNTFPRMSYDSDSWLPPSNELWSAVYARSPDLSDLYWRNLFENPTTVQLVHRLWATTTFFSVLASHFYINRVKLLLPSRSVKAMHAVMGMVTLQVTLGICTLWYLVPIPLAAAHQAGAIGLLTACLAFASSLRSPTLGIRVLLRKLAEKGKGSRGS